MDAFEKKTLKTSRGYTYTYYTSPGDKTLPTLFFQHGYPDHAAMWKDVAGPLKRLNHPIIIPDMLGYEGTDKPTDPAAYTMDKITKDLVEILDAEEGEKCISIGHDWGSSCASRFYNFYPDRVVGLANLNVPYVAPARVPFDLDEVNATSTKMIGYPMYDYWYLFTAPDGPEVLKANIDRFYNCMHGVGNSMMQFFCVPDGMRNYLTGKTNPEVQLRQYAQDPTFRQNFIDRFSRDGFEAPQCWYKSRAYNLQHQCDRELPLSRDKVEVPMLYIGTTEDPVCIPERALEAMQLGQTPKLEQAELIQAAHWAILEKPNEVVVRIENWLKKNYH
jgi:pimeloyl-ACP methyl ester carboxylesterase